MFNEKLNVNNFRLTALLTHSTAVKAGRGREAMRETTAMTGDDDVDENGRRRGSEKEMFMERESSKNDEKFTFRSLWSQRKEENFSLYLYVDCCVYLWDNVNAIWR